jgi:hypothetical protein
MKKLAALFEWLGFIIQYILPVLLFSDVVPYVVKNPNNVLTVFGIFAGILIVCFIFKKIREKILQMPQSTGRGIILSLYPLVEWGVIWACLKWLCKFLLKFSQYWGYVGIFILVGRIFCVVGETVYNIDKTKGE